MLSDVLVFLQEKEQKYVFAMLVNVVILSSSWLFLRISFPSLSPARSNNKNRMLSEFPIPALWLLVLAAQLTLPTVQ